MPTVPPLDSGPDAEVARALEMQRAAVLDVSAEKAFGRITARAARIFNVPISTVTLIDEHRQWFKTCFGLETREVSRATAFCAQAILSDEVMIVPDASADARFADDPLVTGEARVRFYAGAPLRTHNGLNLGTLCVMDTQPGAFTQDAAERLADLASLLVEEIELRYKFGAQLRAVENLRLLNSAVQQTTDSVMITTAEPEWPGPEIVFVNPAFTRMSGYSAGEVTGKTPRILQGPKTDHGIVDGMRASLSRGEEFLGESINYRKDGSELVVGWHVTPIAEESGKFTHFLAIQRDMTERNKELATLQAAKGEAERANRAKSDFLSRMSHELRTPLNAILGFAQLLELDVQNPKDAESVAYITRAGKHLLSLINEVLDLARVESGKLALGTESVDVRETLEEALALVRPLAAERRVRLEASSCDSGQQVLSSAQHLRQVILNLLSNAIKYNREGGSVTVSCEKNGDFVRIGIADTGHGIAPADIAKLFVPFERLEVRDSCTEGAGLGLALSKHLTEAMGGKIGVESVFGQGATFWVELPLLPQPAAAEATEVRELLPPEAEPPRVTTARTLLYIEDNLSNLRLIERILARRPEVKLLAAMQGTIGLELARQHRPDLVLLDLHLPDLQGEEVLRQLRAEARTQAIPVVMISADATATQVERLRAAGASAYLTKPIDVRQFLAIVDNTVPLPPSGPSSRAGADKNP